MREVVYYKTNSGRWRWKCLFKGTSQVRSAATYASKRGARVGFAAFSVHMSKGYAEPEDE